MPASSRRGALVAALLGIVATTVAWLAIATPLSLGLTHPWPIAAPASAPEAAARTSDPARAAAAVLLSPAGTEVTDFLAPYSILAASGAFDVWAVAAELAVAPMNGGLGIVPERTLDAFDAEHPDGAAVVVIPNVLDPDNPRVLDWLRRQSARGAVVASICEGARVLAATGLLDGREATTHFAALGALRDAHPRIRWRDDRRWVEDGAFVTSAGVTAAIDASLQLVARFAGRAAAVRTATTLGLAHIDDAHAEPFALSAADLAVAFANGALVWPKQRVRVALADGADELELAAALDAYPRTFAATSASVAPGRATIRSQHGLTLVPAEDEAQVRDGDLLVRPVRAPASPPFDAVLRSVAQRFGGRSAELVARQLQYPADRVELASVRTPIAGALARLVLLLVAGASAGLAVRALWRRRARSASRRVDATPSREPIAPDGAPAGAPSRAAEVDPAITPRGAAARRASHARRATRRRARSATRRRRTGPARTPG
jgi:transcriptional regulator GlxA family with amidase domain